MEPVKCAYCIMDNENDQTIRFDSEGRCQYCKNAEKHHEKVVEAYSRDMLQNLIDTIKSDCKNDKYDCIMGISGGIDSSYLLYLGYKCGLRVLTIHIDDGFDTEISQSNIKKLVKACGFDYVVVKPDKTQFNELMKAIMKSGIENLATVQDNCLFSELYRLATENKIKYFLSGANVATESIGKSAPSSVYDMPMIKDINRRFGTTGIDKLRLSGERRITKLRGSSRMQTVYPLNLIDYDYKSAFDELREFCGFQYYGSKHLENYLTAFVQLRWYPERHNIDKRRWHYSSMIVSGQMTRNEAMQNMQQPLCSEENKKLITRIISERLSISPEEIEQCINDRTHNESDYKHSRYLLVRGKILRILSKVYHFFMGKYKQ